MKTFFKSISMSTVLLIGVTAHAITYKELSATPTKLALFTGGSPSVDAFFIPYQSELLLRMSANNLNLNYDSNWNYAGMPQVSPWTTSAGTYARIGDGQCVTFVKTMANNITTTSNWKSAGQVTGYWDPSALVGKIIATFPNGSYYGHTAVILSAWKKSGSNTVTNVWVVDANYTPSASIQNGGSIAKHEINTSGSSSVSNLNNYYIVKVPQ